MTLFGEIRHSARSLAQRPAFVLALLLTVALGVGSNAVVLGFMNGLFSRRTPLSDEEKTAVSVFAQRPDGSLTPLSYGQYTAIATGSAIFASIAAVRETRVAIGIGPRSLAASTATTTPEGRAILGLPSGDGVVLSQGFRDREFAEDIEIARQALTIDGETAAIAGVAPAALEGLFAGRPVDIWVIVADAAALRQDDDSQTLSVIAHLRDGVTLRQARAALDTLAQPGSAFVAQPYTGLPPETQQGMNRLATLLAAAAGAVFLIACANVTILLLSRAAHRSQDVSMRLALGATRGALAKAVLVESALIAIAGGSAGLLVALWTSDVIPTLLFEADAASMNFVTDSAAIFGAAGASALITLACGMVPLLENRHDTPGAVLRRESRRSSKGLQRLRLGLVVFQMAACCSLVISAATLSDAVDATVRTTAGDQLGRPILASVESAEEFRRQDLGLDYFRRAEATVREVPGITAVAWTSTLPGGSGLLYPVKIEPPALPHREVEATAGLFTPQSMKYLELPPKRGRMFGGGDTPGTCRVAVVEEQAAVAMLGEEALGRTIDDEAGDHVEIIGVVRPRASSPLSSNEPSVYYYAEQGEVPFDASAPVKFRVPQLPPIARGMLNVKVVTRDYFPLMRVPLEKGELFTDSAAARFCRIGVINEEGAQLYFGGHAVGGAVIDGAGHRTTIVGVVRDVRLRTTQRNVDPTIYVPIEQEFLSRMHMVLGSADASADLQQLVHRRLEAVEGGKPDAIVVTSLDDRLRQTALAAERIAALLFGAASINALAIGILGLHRILADDVLVRRREIAVRAALGAQQWRLITMVVTHGVRMAAVGGLFGIIGAMLLARWMRSVTGFQSSPFGWIWLIGPAVLLAGALVATVLPAFRMLRVAPLTAMRTD